MVKVEILSVRNPVWVSEDAIDCMVRFNTLREEVPFTASPHDLEPHGREIYERCVAGEFGEIMAMETRQQEESFQQVKLPSQYQRLVEFISEANQENSRKSFRSVVIVWGSFLDNLLDEILENQARASNSLSDKPPKTFGGRISRALKLGLIDDQEAEKCHQIRHIRNAAAHDWRLSLASKDVLLSLQTLHKADHSDLLVFHEDLEFLVQQVYISSCAMLMMRFMGRLNQGELP